MQGIHFMKRYFTKILIITLFFLMLLFPQETFSGASRGLMLWFQTVLPTLLPFVIFSNLLLYTHAVDLIARLLGPVLGRLLHVSDYGAFAVLAGFLCGYPMGSKVTADLLREGHISWNEASYLLSFCNNASPIFIISYVVLKGLGDETLLLPSLVILFGSPILASFLFRRKWLCNASDAVTGHPAAGEQTKANAQASSGGSLVDLCIMNGCETITKVGGYIMLFSIFLTLAAELPVTFSFYHYLLLPSLEVTNGIALLSPAPLSGGLEYLLCMMQTSFGGWCAVAQTKCMLADTGLSIRPYITEKLVTMLITSLLTIAYLKLL